MARSWSFWLLVAAVVLVGCDAAEAPLPAPTPAPAPQRPNVVLIMADDLGYETLGANGGLSYQTPRLDALAQTGMRFTHCYATPLCTPSRVQLMTGQYNFRNYIGFGLLDPTQRTFAHHLQAAGYRTAVFGKWQLFGNAEQRRLYGRTGSLPEQAGFDEYCLWQIDEGGLRYKDPFLYLTGQPAQSFPGAYGPDVFVDCIEDFLERHRDRPFFVYYPMVLAHKPFQPTPDHPDYATSDPETDGNDPAFFAGYVAYMDKMVGRIVDHLDRLGLRDNTLVLFTGDNGTTQSITSQLGDRMIQGGKGNTTEAGIHVPLIANWPGTIAPGRVNDNLIDFTDFLPTLMAVTGAAPPGGVFSDGLSFYPQLAGQPDTVRAWIFGHYEPRWDNYRNRRYVQDRAWKLYDDGSFYHVAEDPDERMPLADAALPADVLQLKQRFQEVLDRMR